MVHEARGFASGSYLRESDLICVLHGALNPVALRHGNAETWIVMESCYLEGWMDPWSHGKIDWKEDEGVEFVLA